MVCNTQNIYRRVCRLLFQVIILRDKRQIETLLPLGEEPITRPSIEGFFGLATHISFFYISVASLCSLQVLRTLLLRH